MLALAGPLEGMGPPEKGNRYLRALQSPLAPVQPVEETPPSLDSACDCDEAGWSGWAKRGPALTTSIEKERHAGSLRGKHPREHLRRKLTFCRGWSDWLYLIENW